MILRLKKVRKKIYNYLVLKKLKSIEDRLNQIESKIKEIEGKISNLEKKIEKLEEKCKNQNQNQVTKAVWSKQKEKLD